MYNRIGIKEEKLIVHRFSGKRVIDILKLKKGSIKQAQLPESSPSWDEINQMFGEEIEANANLIVFKAIPKLLSDRRFDK
ncbi:MAG: hypothetical protein AB4062_13985 [Crocosphaera sp.]